MTDLRDKIARALDPDPWRGGDSRTDIYGVRKYRRARSLKDADAVLAVLDLAQVRAEAQVEALREAADEAESREIAIHGSAHYDSDVLFSIRDRADRIAREAGIETKEANDD